MRKMRVFDGDYKESHKEQVTELYVAIEGSDNNYEQEVYMRWNEKMQKVEFSIATGSEPAWDEWYHDVPSGWTADEIKDLLIGTVYFRPTDEHGEFIDTDVDLEHSP